MTQFSEFGRRLARFAADNSPAILTGVAVVGTATTAYLTGRASFKAAEVLRSKELHFEAELEREMDLKDKVELTWKLYISAAGTGLLTAACIICANRISDRRAAALASAYSLAQRGFEEYRVKVIEKIGQNKEEQVRTEIAQKHVEEALERNPQQVIIMDGTTGFHDDWSGRLFESDMETVKSAVNKVNHQIINHMYASINDFYDAVGWPTIPAGDDFGWNTNELLDVDFQAVRVGQRAYMSVIFTSTPVDRYHKFG